MIGCRRSRRSFLAIFSSVERRAWKCIDDVNAPHALEVWQMGYAVLDELRFEPLVAHATPRITRYDERYGDLVEHVVRLSDDPSRAPLGI